MKVVYNIMCGLENAARRRQSLTGNAFSHVDSLVAIYKFCGDNMGFND